MTSPLQQKLKITGPVVVTANRLGDGAVIYRSTDGIWTTDLATAVVVTTAPAAQELLTSALADRLEAVDPYVAPVRVTPGQGVLPGNLREQIRSSGPTVAPPGQSAILRTDHVHLRRLRPHFGRRARARVPRSGGSPPVR